MMAVGSEFYGRTEAGSFSSIIFSPQESPLLLLLTGGGGSQVVIPTLEDSLNTGR